jgi:replicative DNA helicase
MALMSKKGYFVNDDARATIPHLRFLSNTEGLLENCEIISENYHVKQRARLAMELLSSLKLKQLPSDVFSKHDEGLENLERRRNDMNSERISFADDLESTFISIEKAKLSGITITGLDTGIEELTKYTAGFQKGELSIIGGVPGRGKSTLGIQFFNHIASQLIPCLFVSIEMTPNQYNRKLFAARTGVSVSRQILCDFNDDELLKIKGAKDDLKKLPFFSETKKMSLSDIVRSIKFHVLSNGVQFVLVDHLHIIKIDSGLTGEAKYNFISN